MDEILPSGKYRIVIDQALSEGLAFNARQRIRTLLFLPDNSLPGEACEIVPVDPNELEAAQAAHALESP